MGEEVTSTEYALIAAAVAIAILGIVVALVRLKPAALVPKRDAVPSRGFAHVVEEKYYVDEAYDTAIAIYGTNHEETRRAATLFVDLYEALGNRELQEEWTRRAQVGAAPATVDRP